MKLLLGVLASIAVSGCVLTASQERAQWAAEDDSRCRAYGARPGSDAYVNCRVQQDQRRSALIQGALRVPDPPLQPAPTPPRNTNCTGQVIGNQVHTTCY
jgi:hypothetical protein